jgi:hypothetical protein
MSAPAPFSATSQTIAELITAGAIRTMARSGLTPLEIAHSLIHSGLDLLPAVACPCCLAGEYEAVIEATADRLADIPAPVPGGDVQGESVH